MHVDRLAFEPIYRQIANDLRCSIRKGEYEAGARLPSERNLEVMYDVSRIAVRQALGLLHSEGLISKEQGVGTFVRIRKPVRRIEAKRMSRGEFKAGRGAGATDLGIARADVRNLVVSREPVPDWAADELGIPASTEVLVRGRRVFVDDHPVQTSVSYWPLWVVEGTKFMLPQVVFGAYHYHLEEEKGLVIGRFRERVSARMPMPDEAKALSMASDAGIPLMRVIRTCFTEDGQAIETDEMLLAADRYELEFEFPTA